MSNVLAAGNYHYNLVISEDWDIFNSEVYPINPVLNEAHYFTITRKKAEPPVQPPVRTKPMTCWQVWVNEDGNFQFIFWYTYANNNWVRIYDMDGNLVFEADLPHDDPNLIVDLPDGFYIVRTFFCSDEPIQEFLIGKS